MVTFSFILWWIQIVLSILLVAAILFQQNEAGLGSAFGGSGGEGESSHTRRGGERLLFQATIVLAVLFALSILSSLFV
ncbi:MAG TPA: preprotein translocase subunit SecG [Candidatus Paceibacterota bacterium]|nr:preprotein translocase subunit SecG [Candidatus Paceibacterota bacterium]